VVHHRMPKSIVVAVNAAVKPPADASNVIAVIAESNSETGWVNWSGLATLFEELPEGVSAVLERIHAVVGPVEQPLAEPSVHRDQDASDCRP
jgi:hypothetical protein